MVIYIPIEKYKYMVITESDTILQEYCTLENIRVHNVKRSTKAERYSRAARGTSRAKQKKS